ncbi:MAG: T9SS type A sorting domain-containing protein [Candidatus Krumholzibacteriaceae bacterium]|jgi:hypothetical protein
MGKTATFILLLCSTALLAGTSLHADWVQNGISVCSQTYDQRYPKGVSDGANGAIFVWQDYRSGIPTYGIYAQRVDAWGNPLWTADGVPLYTNVLAQYGYPEIASDGSGGAIVVWTDNRSGGYDVYAQRIDASGTPLWPAAGVSICTATGDQTACKVISDGAGGAIIAWQDGRSGNQDIYAQRIDATGAVQWTADGVAVCTNTFDQHAPCLVTDDVGGAIIAWDDHRSGNQDIYAQRIDASGTVQWTANGKVICNGPNTQQSQCVVSDDVGGAIIAWTDYRSGANWILYAQRIDRLGNVLWTANGVLVSTTVNNMYHPVIVSDGWNGSIIVWSQQLTGDQDIYAQRISYLGYREWNAAGNVVCGATGAQDNAAAVSDGAQGAVVVWIDYRAGIYRDIYAERLDADGLPLWNSNGVAACSEASDQNYPCVVSDGGGGGIFAWEDYRNGSSADVYAQRIERFGYWGYPSPHITSVADWPDDQGGFVSVVWQKSRLESALSNPIARYSIWRMLPAAQLQALLASGAKGVDPAKLTGAAAKPVYYFKQASGTTTGWELMDYVTATNAATYTDKVATLFDSTQADPAMHHFMVMAHANTPFKFWESQPDSGYSVDNIPPSPPVQFSAQQSFSPLGLKLWWGSGKLSAPLGSDFSRYALYRGTSSAFVPDPGNRIYAGPDTTHFDGDWRWNSGFYYKLAAVDIHGNESLYALVGPDDVTGGETPRAPAVSYLEQNAPNPFNPATTIRFGLARQGRATLSIYDVSGRLVRTLVDGPRSAAVYRETWDGHDARGKAVASGVYFYRLRAGTFSETKKMVLTR